METQYGFSTSQYFTVIFSVEHYFNLFQYFYQCTTVPTLIENSQFFVILVYIQWLISQL